MGFEYIYGGMRAVRNRQTSRSDLYLSYVTRAGAKSRVKGHHFRMCGENKSFTRNSASAHAGDRIYRDPGRYVTSCGFTLRTFDSSLSFPLRAGRRKLILRTADRSITGTLASLGEREKKNKNGKTRARGTVSSCIYFGCTQDYSNLVRGRDENPA